jgi:hypothetical protein
VKPLDIVSAGIQRYLRRMRAEFPITGGWICKPFEFVKDFTEDPRRSGGPGGASSSYKLTTI